MLRKCICTFDLPEVRRPVGLMDKASASGAGDSRFESWAGHSCLLWMTLAAKTAGILAWEKGFLL